jgi:voltage-gated potassium channel
VEVPAASALVGTTIRESALRDRTGAMVLAIRGADGEFHTNPSSSTVLAAGVVLIAIGTEDEIEALRRLAASRR